MSNDHCELCTQPGGEVLFQNAKLRVVLVDDNTHPGFCRVIWNAHVKEMTDLAPADRSELMMTVCKIESSIREAMQPEKVNLASLGNMVPHLHWHIIPRFIDDAQFPAPIWAEPRRVTPPSALEARQAMLPQLRQVIVLQLNG